MIIFHSWGNRPAKKAYLLLFSAAFIFFTSSCKVLYQPSYILKKVNRDTIVNNLAAVEAEVKIQSSDVLLVSVSSLNPEEDVVFNAPGDLKGGAVSGYQVSNDGNIYLHKLGKIPVIGLTRKELKMKLEQELQPYFKDPVITVNFENHRITLLGGTGVSKVLNIPAEKISIFEALGSAGGSFENIILNDVVVVREKGDKKEIKHLNLEDHSVFASPWYYLQSNDVVILVPDNEKIKMEQRKQQNQQIATFTLQGISLALIIYSYFFRR